MAKSLPAIFLKRLVGRAVQSAIAQFRQCLTCFKNCSLHLPLQVQAVSVAMPLGLSRCSSSVNSGISTAVTVIVAVAGFSSTEIFSRFWSSSGLLSLVEAEVVFLRFGGNLFISPPLAEQWVNEYQVVPS